MSQSSILLVRIPDIDKVISYLRQRYTLLSDAEIIKLALSEKYQKDRQEDTEEEQKVRAAFTHAIEEGGKLGDKILAEKGLKREHMTEQEIYEAVFEPRKQ